jgi:predicted lysophospholipase L1 biosynthesis ABC-type transport system permease subunit
MFRLKIALLFAILPTLVFAAVMALAVMIRGGEPATGWIQRAIYAAVATYAALVCLILLRTRKFHGE